jgi:predicted RNA-binding protein
LEEQIIGVITVFYDPDKRSELIYSPDKPSQTSFLYDIKNLGYVVQYPYIGMLKDMKKEMNNPILGMILTNSN